jgi:hypothetical protein
VQGADAICGAGAGIDACLSKYLEAGIAVVQIYIYSLGGK